MDGISREREVEVRAARNIVSPSGIEEPRLQARPATEASANREAARSRWRASGDMRRGPLSRQQHLQQASLPPRPAAGFVAARPAAARQQLAASSDPGCRFSVREALWRPRACGARRIGALAGHSEGAVRVGRSAPRDARHRARGFVLQRAERVECRRIATVGGTPDRNAATDTAASSIGAELVDGENPPVSSALRRRADHA